MGGSFRIIHANGETNTPIVVSSASCRHLFVEDDASKISFVSRKANVKLKSDCRTIL